MIDGPKPSVLQRLRRRLPSRNERRVTYAVKVLGAIALGMYVLSNVLGFFAAIRTTGVLLVGGVFLAYLLYPLVHRVNERLPLSAAILVVYLFVGSLLAVFVGIVAPIIGSDIADFGKRLPTYALNIQHAIADPQNPIVRRLPPSTRLFLDDLPTHVIALVQTNGLDALQRSLNVVLSAVSIVGTVIIIPVLAAYLLIDASNLRRNVLGLFPLKRRTQVDGLINDLDAVVGGFIRGQLIDGAIVGLMIFIMLTVMHVPYAIVIGVAAGILNFIPYAGAVAGFVPSVILALASNGPTNALIVAALFAVIQQIDGNFVAPRVLKQAVGLSPVYIILAILAGSELFGIIGTFLAVPIAAMLKVLRVHLLPPAVSSQEAPPTLTPQPRRTAPEVSP